MYELGVEIEPGTYKTDGPAEDALMKLCTWTKYKDASGSADSLSSIDTVQGPLDRDHQARWLHEVLRGLHLDEAVVRHTPKRPASSARWVGAVW